MLRMSWDTAETSMSEPRAGEVTSVAKPTTVGKYSAIPDMRFCVQVDAKSELRPKAVSAMRALS